MFQDYHGNLDQSISVYGYRRHLESYLSGKAGHQLLLNIKVDIINSFGSVHEYKTKFSSDPETI